MKEKVKDQSSLANNPADTTHLHDKIDSLITENEELRNKKDELSNFEKMQAKQVAEMKQKNEEISELLLKH